MVEQRFFWHLVEDRASFHGTYSYSDYMQLVNSGGQGAIGGTPVPNPGHAQVGMGGGGGMPPPPSYGGAGGMGGGE
jgi:hypothetical protein